MSSTVKGLVREPVAREFAFASLSGSQGTQTFVPWEVGEGHPSQ